MCQFKRWYADEHGYVIECRDCKHFQVCFGTTLLTLDENHFQAFMGLIRHRKENHYPLNETDTRNIVIPTPCNTIHALLSGRELDQLDNMLEEADNERRSRELLELFTV